MPNATRAARGTENTAEFFRNLLQDPKWRGQPPRDILAHWELEHGGQKATNSIKTSLAKELKKLGLGSTRAARGGNRGRQVAQSTATINRGTNGATTYLIPLKPENFPVASPGLTMECTEIGGQMFLKVICQR